MFQRPALRADRVSTCGKRVSPTLVGSPSCRYAFLHSSHPGTERLVLCRWETTARMRMASQRPPSAMRAAVAKCQMCAGVCWADNEMCSPASDLP
jgi:hypothetical protein